MEEDTLIYAVIKTVDSEEWGEFEVLDEWFNTLSEAEEYRTLMSQDNMFIEKYRKSDWIRFINDETDSIEIIE